MEPNLKRIIIVYLISILSVITQTSAAPFKATIPEDFLNAFEDLQEVVKNVQHNFDTKIKAQEASISLLQTKLDNLIPLGFIYTELYGQPSPATLWPEFTWTEVSSLYAGQFFRVLGGNSDSFGSLQAESSPRLTDVETTFAIDHELATYAVVTAGQWTEQIYTGYDGNDYPFTAIKFFVSNVETRPINQAVRIWRRTA